METTPRILLIEDDPEITEAVSLALELEGYELIKASEGDQGLELALGEDPDLILLDLGLPNIDGVELCRQIRETSQVPIIMVTARAAVTSRIEGLKSGADDYLVKPFHLDELLARVDAQLRRTPPSNSPLKLGDLKLWPNQQVAQRGERALELTRREFELLSHLVGRPNQVLSRKEIIESIWPAEAQSSNNLEVLVSKLRSKLEEDGESRLIHNVHGRGYVIAQEWPPKG